MRGRVWYLRTTSDKLKINLLMMVLNTLCSIVAFKSFNSTCFSNYRYYTLIQSKNLNCKTKTTCLVLITCFDNFLDTITVIEFFPTMWLRLLVILKYLNIISPLRTNRKTERSMFVCLYVCRYCHTRNFVQIIFSITNGNKRKFNLIYVHWTLNMNISLKNISGSRIRV